MVRVLLLIAGALLIFGCKKESSSSGLPPAKDWQGGQPPPATGGAQPATPRGSGMPSGGMPNDSVHGGAVAGGSGMPNDSVHGGAAGGGGGMPTDSVHGGGGGGGDPATPVKTPPQALEKLADGRTGLGPFTFVAPKEWTEKPSTSSMRAAQFVLGSDAELIVYYFGESGAGSVQDNLDRWLDQFQQPDGKPSKDVAKIEKAKFANQEASIVSVAGSYAGMQMPGQSTAPAEKSGQALLGAIVDSPKGPYYFKLVGGRKTVEANTARFRAMLGSLKLR